MASSGNGIKVAFFISSFRTGGGEKQVIEIANSFAERGYAVDLLVLKPVGQLEKEVNLSIRRVPLDAGRIIFSLPKLVSFLRKERPEVLLSVDEYTHTLSLVARMLSGVNTRIVLRIGNMLSILAERYEGRAKILPHLSSWLFKRADAIVANSHGVADDIVKVTGIEKKKVVVIYNPKRQDEILASSTEPISHPWNNPKTLPIVLAVGRLRVQKNFSFLILAFAKLIKRIPAHLVVVGSGREEGRLRELIQKLALTESVQLIGYLDNPYSWMRRADVFVSASLWEGLPNSLLEALICSTPIIAADCSSGPREILAPDTDYRKRLSIGNGVEYAKYGALYAVNDESALLEALQRLLTDSNFRETYREMSKERAKDFDAYNIVSEYAHVMGI